MYWPKYLVEHFPLKSLGTQSKKNGLITNPKYLLTTYVGDAPGGLSVLLQ